MNEIVLISVITSCVWAVGLLVACMYWRVKKIVDENDQNIHRRCDEIDRILDDEKSMIYRTIDENVRELEAQIKNVSSVTDSRIDKIWNEISKSK